MLVIWGVRTTGCGSVIQHRRVTMDHPPSPAQTPFPKERDGCVSGLRTKPLHPVTRLFVEGGDDRGPAVLSAEARAAASRRFREMTDLLHQ
jgi:hypothetical protein